MHGAKGRIYCGFPNFDVQFFEKPLLKYSYDLLLIAVFFLYKFLEPR